MLLVAAPVVKWISHLASDQEFRVRVLTGAQDANIARQLLGVRQDEKAGAMFAAQFRRGKPRGGVATLRAEASESCDRVLTGAQRLGSSVG